MRHENQKTNIVISGAGILTTHGQGLPAFTRALRAGSQLFKAVHDFPMLDFPVIAARLNQFDFEKGLAYFSHLPAELIQKFRAIGRRSPLTIQTSLLTALEAWDQAQLFHRELNPEKIGLIVAGQNTTQGYQYQLQNAFKSEPAYLPPTYALHFMDTDQVGTLSEAFNIQGEGFTVGGASASGNVGIIQACRLIEQQLVDVCMVVGTLADLSPMELQGFHNMGALGGKYLQPEQACRPFDSEHEGFIWGQASGCLILESTSHAKKSHINSLSHISGTAMNLDANRLAMPNALGEIKAMQQALYKANLAISDLHYINTHGSSSPLGDQTEVSALKEVLKDQISTVWLNSTKSITGHCLWSAGIVEAIATVVQLQEQMVHPNLNLDNPIDKDCRFAGGQSVNATINTALNNSFGFGGINTSIVLTRKEN
ncbi:MAG: beta-ketoacyl synthase N-terminal-like domain-containing protein [Gammaproteobacteria bacterium]